MSAVGFATLEDGATTITFLRICIQVFVQKWVRGNAVLDDWVIILCSNYQKGLPLHLFDSDRMATINGSTGKLKNFPFEEARVLNSWAIIMLRFSCDGHRGHMVWNEKMTIMSMWVSHPMKILQPDIKTRGKTVKTQYKDIIRSVLKSLAY